MYIAESKGRYQSFFPSFKLRHSGKLVYFFVTGNCTAQIVGDYYIHLWILQHVFFAGPNSFIAKNVIINYFLYQFSNRTKKGVNGMSQTDLNAGFYNLKIYFVIISVVVIIALAFVLLFFLAVGANGATK